MIGRSVDVSEGNTTDPGHTVAMHIAQDCYAHKVEIDTLRFDSLARLRHSPKLRIRLMLLQPEANQGKIMCFAKGSANDDSLAATLYSFIVNQCSNSSSTVSNEQL